MTPPLINSMLFFLCLLSCSAHGNSSGKKELARKTTFLELVGYLRDARYDSVLSRVVYANLADSYYHKNFTDANLILREADTRKLSIDSIRASVMFASSDTSSLRYYQHFFYDSTGKYLGDIQVSFYGEENKKVIHLFTHREVETVFLEITD